MHSCIVSSLFCSCGEHQHNAPSDLVSDGASYRKCGGVRHGRQPGEALPAQYARLAGVGRHRATTHRHGRGQTQGKILPGRGLFVSF